MAEQLRRFDHSEGVVFIGKAQGKTPLFRTEKGRNLPERSTLSLDCSLYSPWSITSTGIVWIDISAPSS
jgi:hypothetical protein